jgi:integrase
MAAAGRAAPGAGCSQMSRSTGVLSRYWRETVQAAGQRVIKLHAARHTCATLMHLQGVPIAVIAAWIGHKDAGLTMRLYAHSQFAALRDAGASLDRVVTSCDTQSGARLADRSSRRS